MIFQPIKVETSVIPHFQGQPYTKCFFFKKLEKCVIPHFHGIFPLESI